MRRAGTLFLIYLTVLAFTLFAFEITPEVGTYTMGDVSEELTGVIISPPLTIADFQVGGLFEYIWADQATFRYGVLMRYDFLSGEPLQPYTIGGTGVLTTGGESHVVYSFGAGLRIPGETFNFYIEERIDEVRVGNQTETYPATILGFGMEF